LSGLNYNDVAPTALDAVFLSIQEGAGQKLKREIQSQRLNETGCKQRLLLDVRQHHAMKTLYKLFAILGIAWAVLIHPFLFLQAIGDQQTRRIEALEAVTRSWMGPGRITNGVASISEDNARTYVQRTHEVAEAYNRCSVTYWVISWVSSAFIITLSICALKAGKKDEHHAA